MEELTTDEVARIFLNAGDSFVGNFTAIQVYNLYGIPALDGMQKIIAEKK